MFGYDDVATTVAVALACIASLMLIANLVTKIRELAKPARDASDAIEEHFQHVDKCLASDKARIELIEKRLVDGDEANKITLRCIMQLMEHSIDGNHVEKLRDVREQAQNYLIEH